MPESRTNKERANKRHSSSDDLQVKGNWAEGIALSPRWWAPVMVTLMIIGLLWLVVYYLSGAIYPIPQIGNWNIAIGFGIALIGFLMTLRWR